MWTRVNLTLACVSFKKFAEENDVKNKKKYQSNYLKIWIIFYQENQNQYFWLNQMIIVLC